MMNCSQRAAYVDQLGLRSAGILCVTTAQLVISLQGALPRSDVGTAAQLAPICMIFFSPELQPTCSQAVNPESSKPSPGQSFLLSFDNASMQLDARGK
jgi:hypothetical protein